MLVLLVPGLGMGGTSVPEDEDGGGIWVAPPRSRLKVKTQRQRIEEDDEEAVLLGLFD